MKIFNKAEKELEVSDTYDFIRRNVDSVFFTILNYYKKYMKVNYLVVIY